MINALLTKVAGFFERDFLFASFLPALLFAGSVGLTLAWVIGFGSTWAIIEGLPTLKKATFSTATGIALVMFAYVLNALRPAFTQFWAGRSSFPLYALWGLQQVLMEQKRKKFRELRDRADRQPIWPPVLDTFESAMAQAYGESKPPVPSREMERLHRTVRDLSPSMGAERVMAELEPVVDAYVRYSGAMLVPVGGAVKNALLEWMEAEESDNQSAAYHLDRQFGTLTTICPTQLGNIMASYDQYSAKRYRIEAQIFWPRLRNVIHKDYFAAVEDPRILMDFSLTMASLGLTYAAAATLVGPWLWTNPWLWSVLGTTGVLTGVFFYRLGVAAAFQLGEMIRSSFDLYRLSLLEALGLPHPRNFEQEQETWEEFSRLAVYGVGMQFEIRPRTSS